MSVNVVFVECCHATKLIPTAAISYYFFIFYGSGGHELFSGNEESYIFSSTNKMVLVVPLAWHAPLAWRIPLAQGVPVSACSPC